MSRTIRLTTAQALVRYLMAQRVETAAGTKSLFAGMFAIFGHGNVTGMGEALEHQRAHLPVYRAHNEQAMAHAAIAFAKANRRERMMACTTSIGPGATNMVTAAALAHVNRLPVLLLPGDVFTSRLPDPVLQQIEQFGDPACSANDCFRPVSRYWDRINCPEQLLSALPQAISVLTDPCDCGPVTLALPQDIQARAWSFPEEFFEVQTHGRVRAGADAGQLDRAAAMLAQARQPLIIAGGGVRYSDAERELASFAQQHQVPVAETQAGKGALTWDHPCNVGAIGVTGSAAANELADRADLIIAIGTRLQDFTTGSGALLGQGETPLLSINVAGHDARKRGAIALVGDARRSLEELDVRLGKWCSDAPWMAQARELATSWNQQVEESIQGPSASGLPTDAGVIGVVNRVFGEGATVVAAAGGVPGELHKLWRVSATGDYHLEYGYSCMGYEIAGALGVKMAQPEQEVVVLVGDGSYLMMNSEIATAVAMNIKLTIVLLNNHGFGCIHRLQTGLGGEAYNNLWDSGDQPGAPPVQIDFAAHAASMGARSMQVDDLHALEQALECARAGSQTQVLVINTDAEYATQAGGAWWDVPVAEVSENAEVRKHALHYQEQIKKR